jgi:hypothetical protein
MEILFVASVSVLAPDPAESRRPYVDALGVEFELADAEAVAEGALIGLSYAPSLHRSARRASPGS